MCRAVKPVQARGRLAQLGEHLFDVQKVIGSIPIAPTISCLYTRKGLFFLKGAVPKLVEGTGLENR